MVVAGQLHLAPSRHLVQGPTGRGYVALASDAVTRRLHLFGNRREDLSVSCNDWYRITELDAVIPSWTISPEQRQRHRLACQSAALIQVLVSNPDTSFAPGEIYYKAFNRAPDVPGTSQLSDLLAVLEGADLIKFERTMHNRRAVRYR